MGQVNLNTVLGALGTAGFAGINLRNLVGGLFNQGAFNGMGLDAIVSMLIPMLTQMGCQRSEPACMRITASTAMSWHGERACCKDSKIALLRLTHSPMARCLSCTKYFDGELRGVREFICEQKVRNQGNGRCYPRACQGY